MTARPRNDDRAWDPGANAAAEPPAPAELVFREPVKTVTVGGSEIELRRQSPQERRTRRTVNTLLFLVVGAAVLVALVVVLAGPRSR